MAQRNFLAFDLGAESGRALLGTLAEGKLTLEEKHRFLNPTRWWLTSTRLSLANKPATCCHGRCATPTAMR